VGAQASKRATGAVGGLMDVEKITLIDAQTEVEGKLKGKDARILGRFLGDIELSGRLILGEGSRVEAKIVADMAEMSGEFKGNRRAQPDSARKSAVAGQH
jgi:cytoskeletal protein CcmA (bactofilin family)